MDVPVGDTQEEDHTGFLHLPFAVLAFIFLARRIQPSLSLVDGEVEFCVTQGPIVVWFDGIIIAYYYYLFNYVLYCGEHLVQQWLTLRYPQNMHAGKVPRCALKTPALKDTHSRVQPEAAPCPHSRPNSEDSSVVGTITA